MQSRRLKRERKRAKTKKILRTIIIVLIIYITFNLCYGIYKENSIRLASEEKKKTLDIQKISITEEAPTVVQLDRIEIPETYMDYKVAAKLEIPKIDLETYVLNDYTKKAMDVSPTKYWGPEPNEIGNFCITGHNYKKDNMFSALINLKIGDELNLLDNKNGKYTYTICDIYKVKPKNTEPLEQETNGKRVVTLITCVNYADVRLIIKAVER